MKNIGPRLDRLNVGMARYRPIGAKRAVGTMVHLGLRAQAL